MSGDGTPSRHAIGRGFRTVEMLPGGKCNWPQPVFGRKRAGANVAAATPCGPHAPPPDLALADMVCAPLPVGSATMHFSARLSRVR